MVFLSRMGMAIPTKVGQRHKVEWRIHSVFFLNWLLLYLVLPGEAHFDPPLLRRPPARRLPPGRAAREHLRQGLRPHLLRRPGHHPQDEDGVPAQGHRGAEGPAGALPGDGQGEGRRQQVRKEKALGFTFVAKQQAVIHSVKTKST